MTVEATPSREQYQTNGTTGPFTVGFYFLENSHLQVVWTDAGGVATTLVLDVNYSVSGAGNEDGGTVTTTVAYPNGGYITIVRDVPATQLTDYTDQDAFPAESHERALDKLTMLIQQCLEQSQRTLKFPVSDLQSQIADLPGATTRANRLLSFDSQGRPTVTVAADQSATALQLLLATPSGSSLLGFLQSGAGAILRTAQAKMRETVSVTDFGAVGDGATDCSPAFLLAVKSGRRVRVPSGVYRLASACYFNGLSNFEIEGDGVGCTTIRVDSVGAYTNSVLAFDNCSKFKISGITFDQNNNASFTATRALLIMLSCTDLRFCDNEVVRFTYIGLAVDSCRRFWVLDNYVARDATLNTTNHCINVASSLSISSEGWVARNRGVNSGSIYRGKRITISDNRFSNNGYGGGVVTSGDNTDTYGYYTVSGNYCELGSGIDSDLVYCAGYEIGGPHNLIIGNTASQNGGKGFALLGWRNMIIGNLAIGNGVNTGGGANQAGFALGYVAPLDGAYQCLFVSNRAMTWGAARSCGATTKKALRSLATR